MYLNNVQIDTWTAWTNIGDVAALAVDLDARTVEGFVNGVSAGTWNIPADFAYPIVFTDAATKNTTIHPNYGQREFAHNPPAGFLYGPNQNLPAATIPDGREHFQAITGPGDEYENTESNLIEGSYVKDLYTATNDGLSYTNPVQNNWGNLHTCAFDGRIMSATNKTSAGTKVVGDNIVFTPDPAIVVTTSLRVYTRNFSGNATFGINGADRTALPAIGAGGQNEYGWADLSFTGTLTELVLRDNSVSNCFLQAIEVDGQILYDKQNVGSWSPYLYTSSVLSGTTYDLSNLGTDFDHPAQRAFSGTAIFSSDAEAASTQSANRFIVFNPPDPITVNTSLRVYTRTIATAKYSINGGNGQDVPAIGGGGASDYGWAISTYGCSKPLRISGWVWLCQQVQAIEIDGKILVDGGF